MSEQNKTQYDKVDQAVKQEEVTTPETQPKKLTQVVTTKKRKKNLVERLVVGFLDTDGEGTSVGKRVMAEIIVPSVKDMISNTLKNGVDIWMYGNGRGNNGGPTNYQRNYQQGNKVNHNNQYRAQPQQQQQAPMRTGHAIVDFSFNTRQDAITVLNSLKQQIFQYGYASVADYYDLIGESSAYTHNQYGWSFLDSVQIQNKRGGFVLTLPVPEAIR